MGCIKITNKQKIQKPSIKKFVKKLLPLKTMQGGVLGTIGRRSGMPGRFGWRGLIELGARHIVDELLLAFFEFTLVYDAELE